MNKKVISFFKLKISKDWLNTDETTVYPDAVEAEVYRDDEQIADVNLTKQGDSWTTAEVTEDAQGNPLKRVDPDTQHKYIYSVKEKPIDGFTSEVEKTSDEGDEIDFTMKNTWVGPDYVNVKGQVFWTGDEGKEDLRPDSVKITVVNSDRNSSRD